MIEVGDLVRYKEDFMNMKGVWLAIREIQKTLSTRRRAGRLVSGKGGDR